MTEPGPADPRLATAPREAPSEEAQALFAEYLRSLEVDPDSDFEGFRSRHGPHASELARLFEEYERVSRILERLTPAASFSARLREHYGESVDPGISLSGEVSRAGTRVPTPGGLRGRLTAQSPETARYEVRREIARGGMGAILEVWDRELRRTLAMKVVLGSRPAPGATESAVEGAERRLSRFLEEAQITGQLDHPGIVPVHDIGLDDEARVYFTMQLVDGMDLRRVIDLARARRDGWTVRRVVSLLVRVCEAMAYAHSKGVVHRDLKPANIMVGAFGEVYVMDWGLARVLQEEAAQAPSPPEEHGSVDEPAPRPRVETDRSDSATPGGEAMRTLDGDIVGTPSYMAPEQARGRLEEVGPACDVYSVGAILYHLLGGQAPYEPLGEKVAAHVILDAVRQGPPWALRDLEPEVDGELAAICEKAMARSPGERYPSMMRLALDLRNWVEGRGVGAYTTGTLYRLRKWIGRNRALFAALTAIPVLVTLSTASFILLQQANLRGLEEERRNTELAKQEADASAVEARESARRMAEERDRADREARAAREQQERADEAARLAGRQRELATAAAAQAAGAAYRATLSAAAYSLRLDEADAARRALAECQPGLRGWEWRHLSLRVDASEPGPIVQEQGVSGLSATADGALLATYGIGLRPRLWDAPSRRLVRDFDLQASVLLSGRLDLLRCALSPDGALLALTEPAVDAVAILDARGGEVLYTLGEHRGPVVEVGFSPDGALVATAALDGVLRVHRTDGGERLHALPAPGGEARALAFAPDGGALLGAGAGGRAVLHDLAGERAPIALGVEGDPGLLAVDWSPTGELVLLAGEDGRLETWDARTGAPVARMHGHRGAVRDALFSADGESVISGGDDHTVRRWEARTGRALRTLHGHEAEVRGLVRLSGGRVASCSLDGTVRCWDPERDPAVGRHAVPGAPLRRVALDGEGRLVRGIRADGSLAGPLDLDAPSAPAGESPPAPLGEAVPVALASAARRAARLAADGVVEVVEADGSVRRLEGLPRPVTRLALAADGSRLAVGARRRVTVVDLASGERRGVDLRRGVSALALSEDGARLATAEDDESLRLWDAATGALLGAHRDAHSTRVTALAFAPGGAELASASRDETARLWRLPELELLAPELAGLGAAVTALAHHPTEPRLATGTADGRVVLWSRDGRERLLELLGHEGAVQDLVFSPDGERLLSSGADGSLRVWESRGRGRGR